MSDTNSNPSGSAADAAVFCTALVDSDPRRYQSWIDYYTEFFAGQNVDLWMYNDGPATTELNLRQTRLVTFDAPLGRPSQWQFPGWKRSFSTAVRDLSQRYRYIGHIESDTVVLPRGKQEYLRALRSPGYKTGYTARHHFVETALQIINSDRVRRYIIQRYSDSVAYQEDTWFEVIVQYDLHPRLFMYGERIEDDFKGDVRDYNYLSQMKLYRYMETFAPRLAQESAQPGGMLARRVQYEIMHMKWVVRGAWLRRTAWGKP